MSLVCYPYDRNRDDLKVSTFWFPQLIESNPFVLAPSNLQSPRQPATATTINDWCRLQQPYYPLALPASSSAILGYLTILESPFRRVQQRETTHGGSAEFPLRGRPVSRCPAFCTSIGEERPRCSGAGLVGLDPCRPCSATASSGRAAEQGRGQEGFREEHLTTSRQLFACLPAVQQREQQLQPLVQPCPRPVPLFSCMQNRSFQARQFSDSGISFKRGRRSRDRYASQRA